MTFWRPLCVTQFFILLCVYTFLGLTGEPGNYVPMFNDKLMHCSGYIVAAFSISFAFPHWKPLWRALFLIGYSILIEILQYMMPPRTFDVFDICANTTGVILGLLLVSLLVKKLRWFNQLFFWQTSPGIHRITR